MKSHPHDLVRHGKRRSDGVLRAAVAGGSRLIENMQRDQAAKQEASRISESLACLTNACSLNETNQQTSGH